MIAAYPNSPKSVFMSKVYRGILIFTHNFNSNFGHNCVIIIHRRIKLIDYLKQLMILVLDFIYMIIVHYMKLRINPVTLSIPVFIIDFPHYVIASRVEQMLYTIKICSYPLLFHNLFTH